MVPTFAVLSVAVISFSLVQSMSIPVLGEIAHRYDASPSMATWALTGYLLSASVATPIMGRIGDAVGKTRMLVVSLLALCLGSLVAAAAPTIEILIAARVIQGLGGGVLPLSFGIVRDSFPERLVARGVGFMSSLVAVGMAAGIVVAGPVLDGLGFAWLFLLPAALTGAAAVAAARLHVTPPHRAPADISIRSAVLLAAWLVLVLVGVTWAPAHGWSSPRVVAALLGGVLAFLGWCHAESRARVPVVDLQLMRIPTVAAANLVAVLVGFGAFASYGFIPQFVQTPAVEGFGFTASVTTSGLMLMPAAVATFVTGIVAVPLAARVGAPRVIAAGSLIAAGGMVVLVVGHRHGAAVYAATGLVGLGVGLVFACLAAVVVVAVPAEQTGVASGMNANLRTLGGAVGSAVVATIVAAHVDPHTSYPTERGYLIGFAVLAAMFVVAAFAATIVGLVTRRRVARIS